MPPEGTAWRLESFDLRAGLAFATYRAEQTDTQEVKDWPCLFFAPPDFSAEPVDNVAAALAANRGSFDAGMIVNDREAGFETPEEVGEFVRRAYVSSAGGDGADAPGSGGAPMPPLPDLPRERIALLFEAEDLALSSREVMRRHLEGFDVQVIHLAQGNSFKPKWAGIVDSDPVQSLGRGAMQVLVELFNRFPGPKAADRLRWLEDYRLLSDLVSGLGLWSLILKRNKEELRHQLRALFYRAGWAWVGDEDPLLLLYFLFFFDEVPDDADVREWTHFAWPRRFWLRPVPSVAAPDPLETLSRIPLPSFASSLAPPDSSDQASIKDLLVACISTPRALVSLPQRDSDAALDMLVFAAACVVTNASGRTLPHPIDIDSSLTDLQEQAIRDAGRSGLAWLVEQLPARGFAKGLEERIQKARDIRYRSAHA